MVLAAAVGAATDVDADAADVGETCFFQRPADLVGQAEIEFGTKALRLPAKRAGEATVRVIGRFAAERDAGETFSTWLDRVGGAAAIGQELKELDVWPTFEERPDFYVDYGETGPYVAETGESECAT